MSSTVARAPNRQPEAEPSESIPQEAWDFIIEFCKFEKFSTYEPKRIHDILMRFIRNVDEKTEEFSKTSKDVKYIVSSINLILQKIKDSFTKFTPLLLKLLSRERFVTDKYEDFCLQKEDFSYYFALDFTADRIVVRFYIGICYTISNFSCF